MTVVYKDKAGNKLYSKVLKGGRIQIYAKNRRGGLVNALGVKTLMRRAYQASERKKGGR